MNFFLDKFSISFFKSVEGVNRSVLNLTDNQSNHLSLRNQYCPRGRFKLHMRSGHERGILLLLSNGSWC